MMSSHACLKSQVLLSDLHCFIRQMTADLTSEASLDRDLVEHHPIQLLTYLYVYLWKSQLSHVAFEKSSVLR
jgi:hypothetical protein